MPPNPLTQVQDPTLEEILITPELFRRPSHPADHQAESHSLVALAREMADNPQNLLHKLVEMAVGLCGAGSAGISLLKAGAEGEIFFWEALAGVYAPHVGGSTPRDFSPCGTTLDRGTAQLFSWPARYFTYFSAVEPPIVEGLVIPFSVGGRALGTIWIVSHDEHRRFDAEDLRVMTSLSELTGAALRTLSVHEGVARTATELRQANEALRASEQALQEADRRKNEFLATLAHELRNPLAPITNALHILRVAEGDSPLRERALGMVDRQVRHLVRLVDDLLEISRITRGKLELRKEPTDIGRIVRCALETSRPAIEAAGHELTVTVPDEPLLLEADPIRLSQVLANLLNNAARYTDSGGRIWLTAGLEGGEAVIRVRDSGIGIPAPMLPRVFEIFTQVEPSRGSTHGGLGIGLAIVQRLVGMHGGTVEAESPGPGLGSTFTVRLPLLGADDWRPDAEAEDGRARSDAAPFGRVLVVDDNRDAAESLGTLLEILGSEVRVVHDGPSALEIIGTFQPSLVLLDIGMPGMDGCEVAHRVRSRSDLSGVTLVAVTGWGQEEDRRRSRDAGFDHHLVKPVELDTLRRLLSRP
ncbi:MAG TPA: ATP-binding protein [Thermoanaerobaculia bacterium]|nr:ATP-binding protein [Thermoanaerobaculia bacterium]